ncbi:MAG: cytochrome c biogenesis protein CcsA [Paludibacteraceae bacterium]
MLKINPQMWSPFRLRPNFFTGLLHIALVTIVTGACVTHFLGEQGEVHLRADKAQTLTHQSIIPSIHHSVSLFLWDFQAVNDAEGNPADYITELRLLDRSSSLEGRSGGVSLSSVDTGFVRMNKPLKYKGFRFCQTDYDSDLSGVVLTYNYDPWGIGITYAGYALLLIGMIGFFFRKNTFFRALLKSLAGEAGPTAKRSFRRLRRSYRVLQRSGLTGACAGLIALAVFALALAAVMTKVVTPKPPLQPVLQTPLLGIHVSVIMLAYTLFAIIAINGVIGLVLPSPEGRARVGLLSQILLYPALFCLTTGIFVGAVWANLSWGRYWGWDPKETWALITMLVYTAFLHWPVIGNRTAKRSNSANGPTGVAGLTARRSYIAYHVLSIVAFLFVLFTYFGVSYLLGGLHSYAN